MVTQPQSGYDTFQGQRFKNWQSGGNALSLAKRRAISERWLNAMRSEAQ